MLLFFFNQSNVRPVVCDSLMAEKHRHPTIHHFFLKEEFKTLSERWYGGQDEQDDNFDINLLSLSSPEQKTCYYESPQKKSTLPCSFKKIKSFVLWDVCSPTVAWLASSYHLPADTLLTRWVFFFPAPRGQNLETKKRPLSVAMEN